MPLPQTIQLMPFQASPATQPFSCSLRLQLQGEILVLNYTISGPLHDLIIPVATASPGCTPELWLGTCFECFLRQEKIKAYREWNFSPSGNWWACLFDGYRSPARQQPQNFQPQQFDIKRTENLFTLITAIACPQAPRLRIGPALILEHTGGSRSHWAMQHPGAKPDFHLPGTCACIL